MIPSIPTFPLLEGFDGTAKAAPDAGAGTDLFTLLVARLGSPADPTSAPIAASVDDEAAMLPVVQPAAAHLPLTQPHPSLVQADEPGAEAGAVAGLGEAELPQAALVAVLAAQLPVTPASPVAAAAAGIASNIPADKIASPLHPTPAFARPGDMREAVAEQPAVARTGLAGLPGPAVMLVPEPVRTTRRTDQPLGRAAHAAAPAVPPDAPAVPAPVERTVPALQSFAAQPVPHEAPAAIPDHVADLPAVEQAVEQQLDLANESEWLDSLARDIVRVGDGGTLRFRLHPESLGSLGVEISQGATGASVRLTADNEAARTIIADAQPRLMAEARAQGVRIAETHVDLSGGGHATPEDRRGRHGTADEMPVRIAGGETTDEAASTLPVPSPSERYA